jgi:Immunity protein 51
MDKFTKSLILCAPVVAVIALIAFWPGKYQYHNTLTNEDFMSDQNAIRAEFRIDGDSVEGFYLSFDAMSGMIELMPAFEKENSYGNGPAWECIAEYLISRRQGLEEIDLDSESDAFLAVCKRREPLEKLRAILLEVVADEQTLRDVIRQARAAGFGHGDL